MAAAACDDSGSTATTGGATTGTATTGGATSTTGAAVMGQPIPFSMGWADLANNTYGIQGAFYTFGDTADGGGSTIAPDSGAVDFSMYAENVCAAGTAGMVMNGADGMPAFSTYWGAAIGFNLSQEKGVDTALPYNASTNGVVGFAFNVGGTSAIPTGGELRFNVKVNGDTNNYCAKITTPGANSFMLTDLHQSCWDAASATLPTPDPSKLEALHWQYVTNTMASYTFNLCISDLRVLTN